MKTIKMSERLLVFLLTLTGLICISVYATSCTGVFAKDKVIEAYDLRIDGHADSAIVLLNNLIIIEPNNASAYYELARAQKHMMLARGGYEISDIITNASKASDLAPTNLSYAYFEAHAKFLDVYIDIMNGKEDVKEKLDASVASFEQVLVIDACFPSVLITLTEIYAMLPPEYGGSRDAAIKYADKLEDCDPIQALKADAFLLQEEGDLLEYWLEIYNTYDSEAEISEELGRAYLLEGDIENGKKYLEEAISLDPDRTIIFIDLGRAMMMNAMSTQKKELGEEALLAFTQYMDANPNAPGPMQAYVYSMMALVCQRIIGNETLADDYATKKDELDPFCSRASGAPAEGLFIPPGDMPVGGGYYSRPF